MTFDYSKLKGRIIEKYGSQTEFAKRMNWSERTLSLKMNNQRKWKQNEICEAMVLLDLPDSKIIEYFFRKKVQNI